MFTGIVEELGRIETVERGSDSARLTITAPTVCADARHGDSIAVNGVCLTVTEHTPTSFTADVMLETLTRTELGTLTVGSPVNLERPVTLQSRLGGHLVQGHVDGTGRIRSRTPGDRWEVMRICLPPGLARYVVEKGSIAVDGTSLTVTDVTDEDFGVSLIPATLQGTTLGTKGAGDPVNLEVDLMAKYVERLLEARV